MKNTRMAGQIKHELPFDPNQLADIKLKSFLYYKLRRYKIRDILYQSGQMMDLDNLLIRYYKETGEILQRIHLMGLLSRMSQCGEVYRIPKRQGVYSFYPPQDGREKK